MVVTEVGTTRLCAKNTKLNKCSGACAVAADQWPSLASDKVCLNFSGFQRASVVSFPSFKTEDSKKKSLGFGTSVQTRDTAPVHKPS